MAEKPKLTRAQRDFLVTAAERPSGNPWPMFGVRQRAGGALNRMSLKLGELGLMDKRGLVITDAGRAAVADELAKRQAFLSRTSQ